MNQSAEKLTLAEAITIERLAKTEHPKPLHAPGLGLDQAPPVTPCVGQPVQEGIVIRATPHPEQKLLALKAVERCPTGGEQQAFDKIWADIDTSVAANAALEKENCFWGFTESPEALARRAQLPKNVFWLADVVKKFWCARHYKTKAGLIEYLLGEHKYPPRLLALDLITRAGYDILISRKLAAKHENDKQRQQKKYIADQAAKQAPEPLENLKKSRASGLSKPRAS
jgi:hypothetical protein